MVALLKQEKEQQLIKQIAQFIKSNTDMGADTWAYIPISSDVLNSRNNYLILMDWQEGYDETEHTKYIKNGYGLNVTVRVDHDQYFACDNPYPVCNIEGDCIDGFTLSVEDEADNFISVAQSILSLLKNALLVDEMNIKGLTYEEQQHLFKLQEQFNLSVNSEVHITNTENDEDLQEFLEKHKGETLTISDFSYYDYEFYIKGYEYPVSIDCIK